MGEIFPLLALAVVGAGIGFFLGHRWSPGTARALPGSFAGSLEDDGKKRSEPRERRMVRRERANRRALRGFG